MAITKITGTPMSLEEAQKFVGGFVELIKIGNDQMIINDGSEGFDSSDINSQATKIAILEGCSVSSSGIAGNVLILTGDALWK